ncbi:MAG: DNA gyrase/topoisomerase IV subunit B [Clostridia bacterium]|jgi:DNA gyrase subunit B|nr:DNA topoisomerase [Clostridiaceae bacterium]
MSKAKTTYDDDSIRALKGPDRVRLRPAVIFGSDGLDGCKQSFFEILSNSIDEAREGYGNVIEVTRFKDKSIMVKDYGRGTPVEFNEKEGRYNWELIYCELYAGGKYDNNKGDFYQFSLGLNGLGCCATQYSAEYMDVEVYRNNKKHNLHFEKGYNIGGLKTVSIKENITGTTIKWRPDLEVFTEIDIPVEFYVDVLKKQAVVNKGLKFLFYDEESDQTMEFLYEDGIKDYVKELSEDKAFTDSYYYTMSTSGRDRKDKPEYRVKAEVCFCFSNAGSVIEYYHNSSFLEYGGAPDKAVRSAFVSVLDQFLKQKNMYNKNESKITYVDVQDCLVLVLSSFSTITSYENQTKKAITNAFIQKALTDFLKEKLEIFLIENAEDAEKVLNQVLVNKRSRETAESTRINIRKKLSGGIDINNRVKKFVDCRTKDVEKRELYIVEGDSALGSCKLGRNAEFQAIMPVRGKILNCLKSDINTILKNDVIVDLIKVLGCGVEIQSSKAKDLQSFDMDKLRWNKIIICTDADVDGYQIRTLILTMLYRLVPSLIKNGKVFIAETPLYEITSSDKKTYFAYDEGEKAAILAKLKGKCTIQRSKGLGENEPEMMWETTMNPETRRLIRIDQSDMDLTERMFDILLGENLNERKKFIRDHGRKYVDLADIS